MSEVLINKVALNNTKSNHNFIDLSHHNNTTASIGTLQTLFFRDMEPNESIKVSYNSLLRANAMVSPSWLDLNWKLDSCFVPIDSVYPNYDFMRTRRKKKTSQSNFIPAGFPTITESDLWSLTLVGATPSAWIRIRSDERALPSRWHRLKDRTGTASSTEEKIVNACSDLFCNNFVTIPDSTIFADKDNVDFQLLNNTWVDSQSHVYFNVNFLHHSQFAWNEDSRAGVRPVFIPLNSGIADSNNIFFDDGISTEPKWDYSYINPSRCDTSFILPWIPALTPSGHEAQVMICFKRSLIGNMLCKHIRSFGYKLTPRSRKRVSLLPFVALYRAYFGRYGIERIRAWEDTYCHRLIHEYSDYNRTRYSFDGIVDSDWNDPNSTFWSFIHNELLHAFYPTLPYDYVSAHRATMTESKTGLPVAAAGDFVPQSLESMVNSANSLFRNLVGSSVGHELSDGKNYMEDPSYFTSQDYVGIKSSLRSDSITADGIELLKRLSLMTNKSDVLGANVRELLRALGYGEFVEHEPINFVGSRSLPLNIFDVTALADTYKQDVNGDSSGSFAGEVSGKSVTSSHEQDKKKLGFDKPLKFATDKRGFFFVFGSIIPSAGYVNFVNQKLYKVTADDQYEKTLDGIGYDADSKENLFGAEPRWVTKESDSEHYFGMVPHNSSLKVQSNILNGDFCNAFERENILQYVGDKVISMYEMNGDLSDWEDSGDGYMYRSCDFLPENTSHLIVPEAGEAWAYAYKFIWLGELNRCFVNWDGKVESTISSDMDNWKQVVLDFDYYSQYMADNFIVHNNVDASLSTEMLPISASYRTWDDDNRINDSETLA